ncbi:glycoside hydrolase family protein [Chitinophaga arvensicola]|uniref:Uncharacterized protein n=1 Tax=Chitinophaga arvensicola TaxID=29529 RepID=A0A1I0QWK0_9BACT|nr:hypothetical protein [Chitinophaga arvensicola]SEW31885.1 hypothetical protein SAMN04488122_1813 [Chitinophaga arvensicola]
MASSRRHFIKAGTAGLLGACYAGNSLTLFSPTPANELQTLSESLSATWGKTLLDLQVWDSRDKNYGTIIYPKENVVHGRMGDTFYPFLHLAARTGNSAYLDAAILLYRWMDSTVSQEDGSWLNEPKAGSWKGTTVFSAIALAEAVKQHGHLLDNNFKQQLLDRLRKSGNYIYDHFTLQYGNINYPITATYGLSLLGELLDEPKFIRKGRALAHEVLPYFTKKDRLLSGEGGPLDISSPKGCFSVDLGYNVEESLPSLVMYGLLTKDSTVLETVTASMQSHLAFMLPDGGWDNSWGTRNYKWTYWGSRTSDGCQPAYALMAAKQPVFYKAALRNTQLLASCTREGLLYGGPHYVSHGVTASLHHTFCHLKALVTILDHGIPVPPVSPEKISLPREKSYGSRFFPDIQTGLIALGKYRATVTGYDRNYKEFRGGHTSGGALSMLWHEVAGLIITASMNEYQLFEAGNMQVDDDPHSIPLTPRILMEDNGQAYTNIQDFGAKITVTKEKGGITVHTASRLVNSRQESPAAGPQSCEVIYRFTPDKVSLHFKMNTAGTGEVRIVVPVISPSTETWTAVTPRRVLISRNGGHLQVQADQDLQVLPVTGTRVFNFVPGLEAIPFYFTASEARVEISFTS